MEHERILARPVFGEMVIVGLEADNKGIRKAWHLVSEDRNLSESGAVF